MLCLFLSGSLPVPIPLSFSLGLFSPLISLSPFSCHSRSNLPSSSRPLVPSFVPSLLHALPACLPSPAPSTDAGSHAAVGGGGEGTLIAAGDGPGKVGHSAAPSSIGSLAAPLPQRSTGSGEIGAPDPDVDRSVVIAAGNVGRGS